MWTEEEDEKLRKLVDVHGCKKWSLIASKMQTKASKQCRRRWQNYLNATVKKGSWSLEEDNVLIQGHKIHGNKWTEIAKMVQGRTDNAVKNRFMAICKKAEREKDKGKAASRRNPGQASSSASQAGGAGSKRQREIEVPLFHTDAKRRLCPSPPGITIQIPQDPEANPGPPSGSGANSALNSMGEFTPAELAMLAEIGINPFGTPTTSLQGEQPVSARTRSVAGPTPGPLSRDPSLEMSELVGWLMQNPVPTPTPLGDKDQIKQWESMIEPKPKSGGRLSRCNSASDALSPLRSARAGASSSSSAAAAAAQSTLGRGQAASGQATTPAEETPHSARVHLLQKLLNQRRHGWSTTPSSATGAGGAMTFLPLSPVRRSPRLSASQDRSNVFLDPEILNSPSFSQSELQMLIRSLSDVPTPTGLTSPAKPPVNPLSPRRSPRTRS